MRLDERTEQTLVFIGERSPVPQLFVKVGDEAMLYHEGNLIMATIKKIAANQMIGLITRSACDPRLYPDYVYGKEINFTKENIFGISKMKRQT